MDTSPATTPFSLKHLRLSDQHHTSAGNYILADQVVKNKDYAKQPREQAHDKSSQISEKNNSIASIKHAKRTFACRVLDHNNSRKQFSRKKVKGCMKPTLANLLSEPSCLSVLT